MAKQTFVFRKVDTANSAVVTVGAYQSGEAGNVVAQSAILRLSIRTKTDEDRTMVLNNIRRLTKMQAVSFGCSWEIREGVPGAVRANDEKETLAAHEIAQETFGEDRTTYPGATFLRS